MNRTDRLYAIVEALRRAGRLGRSSSWLAERFEVSSRTIKRDIAALCDAGVPIWSVEGRGGGYGLAEHATLPPLTFTEAEATAVALALAADPQMPFAVDGRAALGKILGAMSPAQRRVAHRLAGRLWMRSGPAERPPTARLIDEALRRQVVLELGFIDKRGQRTTRAVEPMALARTHGGWSLLAWCRLRAAGRWFRLDRIERVHLTRHPITERDLGETFGPPPDDAHPLTLDPS